MSQYGGHEANIYYVAEVDYGVTPVTPAMLGIATAIENIEPALDPGLIKVRGLGSRSLQAILKGLRKVDLKVSYVLSSSHPVTFLLYSSTLGSMSIEVFYEKASGIVDLLHKGCRMDKITVECATEGLIKATAELIGQDVTIGTAKIGNTYTDRTGALSFANSYVQRGDADGSNLVDVLRVSDWKFTIENHLKRVPVIRSTSAELLKYLQERQKDYMGNVTFEFETKTEYDDIIDDNEFSLKFGLGTCSALFKYCKWDKVESPTKIEDLISLNAPFTARDIAIYLP